jgi:uncharacterized DUF497 family protein
MNISFDPAKRQRTLEERNLDFLDAPKVFKGYTLSKPDTRKDYGEDREITIGMLMLTVVVLVWTDRDDSRRIISMRKASDDERGQYYQAMAGSG